MHYSPIVDVAADAALSLRDGKWVEEAGEAVQECAVKQPALITSVNGMPAFEFTGFQCLRIPIVDYRGSDKITGAVVAMRNPTSQTSVIVEGEIEPEYLPSSIWSIVMNPLGDNQFEVRDAGQNFENGAYISDPLSQTRVIIFTIDRSITGAPGTKEMRIWMDGVEQATTQVATDNPTGAFGNLSLSIGSRSNARSLSWAGHLHHVLVLPQLLTDARIADLDRYLANRWKRWQFGAGGLPAAASNGSFQGIVFPTPELALAARDKIDRILRYPYGLTDNYTCLRTNISTGAKAIFVDSVVREIVKNGRGYLNTELNTTTGEEPLDGHTWGRDQATWPV